MSLDDDLVEQVPDAKREAAVRAYNSGVSIASSMLYADRWWILPWYAALTVPSIIGTVTTDPSAERLMSLSLAERFIETALFVALCLRWVRSLAHPHYRIPLNGIALIAGISVLSWLVLNIPTFASLLNAPSWAQYAGIAMLIPFSIFGLRYYFYFLPALMKDQPISSTLSSSAAFVDEDPFLPARVLLGPIALAGIYTAVVTGFSPDMRHLWASLAIDVGAGIFWLASSYLALGVAIAVGAARPGLASSFEPYIRPRLDTMRITAPPVLVEVLHPRHFWKVFLFAVLLWAGNIARLWTLPPAPALTINEATYDPQTKLLVVNLQAHDPSYEFRGFKPSIFRVGGETAEVIISGPTESLQRDGAPASMLFLPQSDQTHTLGLTFHVVHRTDDLLRLKDVYLWYGQVRLGLLSGKIRPASSQQPGAIEATGAGLQGSSCGPRNSPLQAG